MQVTKESVFFGTIGVYGIESRYVTNVFIETDSGEKRTYLTTGFGVYDPNRLYFRYNFSNFSSGDTVKLGIKYTDDEHLTPVKDYIYNEFVIHVV